LLAEGLDCVRGQEPVSALGDHHRVEHDVGRSVPLQRVGDRAHHVCVAEHADLDGVDTDVGEQRLQLLGDDLAR